MRDLYRRLFPAFSAVTADWSALEWAMFLIGFIMFVAPLSNAAMYAMIDVGLLARWR